MAGSALLPGDRRPRHLFVDAERHRSGRLFAEAERRRLERQHREEVYSFTHFDVWGYGTNFFTISMFKSDHNDPASPCSGFTTNSTQNYRSICGGNTVCAGATEFYGLFRSTFGWNEIFGTKAFSMGPLHNISFEIGADIEAENTFLAPAKRDVVLRSAVRLRPSLQGLLQRRALGLQGNQPQRVQLVRRCSRAGHSGRNLPRGRQHQTSSGPGRLKSTTTWTSASCRRTCSTSRSAAVPASMVRRATRTQPLYGHHAVQHRTKTEINSRTDPSDLRRLQGVLGCEVHPLRRRLGCLSLLAEQVRPRPQRELGEWHAVLSNGALPAPTPVPNRRSIPVSL